MVDKIRDFENLYGDTGAPLYEPVDIHKNVNILNWSIAQFGIPNGNYFVRVRHRDSNVEWSPWSDAKSFTVTGSTNGVPAITITKPMYAPSEAVVVTYANGYGKPKDWIGIYKKGQTPGSGPLSTQYKYVSGPNGQVSFTGLPQNQEYFAAFFTDDGYTEIAPRVSFYVGNRVQIQTARTEFAVGDTVDISWTQGSLGSKDWIGVYRVGDTPGNADFDQVGLPTTATGNLAITGLSEGLLLRGLVPERRVLRSVGPHLLLGRRPDRHRVDALHGDRAECGLHGEASATVPARPRTTWASSRRVRHRASTCSSTTSMSPVSRLAA